MGPILTNQREFNMKLLSVLLLLIVSTTASSQVLYGFWEWQHPTQRENGTALDQKEIARYEIIGTDAKGKTVLNLSLSGTTTRHSPAAINRASTFTIAACDTKGLCSNRVPIKFLEASADPSAPRVCQ